MKGEKLFSFLWSCLLAFGISFGAVACLITAFDMQVSLTQTALWCAAGAAVCSLCFTLPMSLVPLGAGALACGYLWQSGSLELSVEALLYRLSRQYNRAYGWGILRWNPRTAEEMELTLGLSLCVLGVFIALVVAWTVCRRKPAVFALVLGLLPLGACLVVTDTVPAVPCLYLLLLGVGVLLLSGAVRRQSAAQGNRVAAWTVLPMALALLILFAAVPQKEYTGQKNAQAMADTLLSLEPIQTLVNRVTGVDMSVGSVDGIGVDLKRVGVRVESRAEVLQVTADYTGQLYLRSRGLDTYDGVSWTDSGVSSRLLTWPAQDLPNIGEVKISTRYAHRMLYVPYYVRGTQTRDMTVGLENENRLTQYSFSCKVMMDTDYIDSLYPSAQAGWAQDAPSALRQFTYLSEEVRAWAEPLAAEITEGVNNPYYMALAIGDYVRASARYDTNTQAMAKNQKDFVKWFLEKSDTGYCIHFASAATVLLQAAGIPARYVTGYVANVTSGTIASVEARQAHAWAEYWLPGVGWVVLEATPPAPEEPTVTQPATEPSAPENTAQEEIPDGETAPIDKPGSTKPQPQKESSWVKILLLCLCVAAGVGALIGQYALRRHLQTKRLSRGTVNQQIINRWFAAVRLARHLQEQPPKELFHLAEKARFSQHTLTSQELSLFDDYLLQKQSVLRSRSAFHQMYYRLILALY